MSSAATTWDDVLRATQLERRQPLAVGPRSADEGVRLRQLLGDSKFVESHLPKLLDLDPVLIATESMPAGAPEGVMDDIAKLPAWARSGLGLDSWEGSRVLRYATDDVEAIANAMGGFGDNHALVVEGPRSDVLRDELLKGLPWDLATKARATDELIERHRPAVIGHEMTHVSLLDDWLAVGRDLTDPAWAETAAAKEEGIVHEAFGDLGGASRVQRPDVGVRRLGVLPSGAHDLDELHATMARMGSTFDTHLGTQLLTKPMTRVARAHGWDAVGEITGAAARAISHDFATGAITHVDIPHAASALREATAWRFGAESEIVSALDDAWKALRVLR